MNQFNKIAPDLQFSQSSPLVDFPKAQSHLLINKQKMSAEDLQTPVLASAFFQGHDSNLENQLKQDFE